MKISAESDDLAEEVCNVLNIQSRLKKDMKHIISNVKGYGMLVLNYVDEMEADCLLMAYYVMPLNQITLLDYF